ncbi:hypothetical protein [Streptomyces sp. NPDC059994]|uniref:AraC-like ligand-binding domain-containing protein n=1 Tax=Streptomyces sp. NPDC059994 TaxID=3347029 RepID=UPI003698635A
MFRGAHGPPFAPVSTVGARVVHEQESLGRGSSWPGTHFDTAGLPQDEQFTWWREAVGRGVAPVHVTSDAAAFDGSIGSLPMGQLHLTTMCFPELRSDRTAALVRQSDPESYELALILGGSMAVSQGRSEARLGAGDFAIWSSSHPYRGAAGESREAVVHGRSCSTCRGCWSPSPRPGSAACSRWAHPPVRCAPTSDSGERFLLLRGAGRRSGRAGRGGS